MAVTVNRREMLRLGLAGLAAIVAPQALGPLGGLGGASASANSLLSDVIIGGYTGPLATVAPFQRALPIPRTLRPTSSDAKIDYYDLSSKVGKTEILPGKQTTVYGYNGEFPGPTIRARVGREVKVRRTNPLPFAESMHLHGSPTWHYDDGHPEILIQGYGGKKTYHYPNNMSGRTLWYHDHAMHSTARNVYLGLAGLYFAEDGLMDRLRARCILPGRAYEIPLLLQDKNLTPDGVPVFDDGGGHDVMGTINTVNGAPFPNLVVEQRRYWFRGLNGSVGRGYRLALSNRMPFTLIDTDAGLMPNPVAVQSFRMGPAERYGFLLDFSKVPAGTTIVLSDLAADGVMRNVMRFQVVPRKSRLNTDAPLPAVLNPQAHDHRRLLDECGTDPHHSFQFHRDHGQWVINGKPWEHGRIDATCDANRAYVWELENPSGGWFHPIHLHLVDFWIFERNGRPAFPWERGWKDVVYLGPNEKVKVVARFTPAKYQTTVRGDNGETHAPGTEIKGPYVMHCHKTVHEDNDMMTQWKLI